MDGTHRFEQVAEQLIKLIIFSSMRTLKSLGKVVIMMGFSGCMLWPIGEKELIGTYQSVLQDGTPALPDGGSEILELRPDGTCTQKIALKDGRNFSTQGVWEYNKKLGIISLGGLHNAVKDDVINPEIERTAGFLQSPSVGRNFVGRIILGSTEGCHYEKK